MTRDLLVIAWVIIGKCLKLLILREGSNPGADHWSKIMASRSRSLIILSNLHRLVQKRHLKLLLTITKLPMQLQKTASSDIAIDLLKGARISTYSPELSRGDIVLPIRTIEEAVIALLLISEESLPVWVEKVQLLLDRDDGVDVLAQLGFDGGIWRLDNGEEVELDLVIFVLSHALLDEWLGDVHPVGVGAVAEVHWLALKTVELPEGAADWDEGDEVESCLGDVLDIALLGVRLLSSLGLGSSHVVAKGEIGGEHIHLASEGVVDTADVVVVPDGVAADSWSHVLGEVLERGESWADLDTRGVHDDVEEGDGGAGVVGGLIGEPDVLWAGRLLLRWVILLELVEEDEAIHWLSVGC